MDLLNYEEITLCAKTQTEPYLSFGLLSYIYFFFIKEKHENCVSFKEDVVPTTQVVFL